MNEKQVVLKPQDLMVCAALVRPLEGVSYARLGQQLLLSSSEVHAAVKRLEHARLLVRVDGWPTCVTSALGEFVVHGVPYVFPATTGGLVQGVPTGLSVVDIENTVGSAEVPPVWPHPNGTVRGYGVTPIHRSIPLIAADELFIYKFFALVDALRLGTSRERRLAAENLVRIIHEQG